MDECLTNIISSVNQVKCNSLITLCESAQEQVKADAKSEQLSANKYFYIFKIAIETKNPPLIELLLYKIQKLFAHGFLDGNCKDNCSYSED